MNSTEKTSASPTAKMPFRKAAAYYLTQPGVKLLARTGVTPTALTWIGLILSLGAAVLIAMGQLIAAGLVVLVAGYFDILDGALARQTNQITKFGGVFDSTADRIAEALTLIGVMALFMFQGLSWWTVIVVGVALLASFLVSYIRSRAEAANIDCQVGLFTRSERVIILAVGLFINQLLIIIGIIAVLSVFTVVQRLVNVYKKAKLS